MHRWLSLRVLFGVILGALTSSGVLGQDEPIPSMPGFRPASQADQLKAEARAVAVPTPQNARAWLRALTEEPHVAGTPADYKTALYVRDKLRAWGWQAELAEYEVLLNYPLAESVQLSLEQPRALALPITETPLAADKDSASKDAFPAFHGYGVSGDVTGQVVYANYGRPEDFDALTRLGVDVDGKIVLVRYGGPFRGLKVLNAQKRGAIGVLIYSDPADDGYMRGDVYPNGPYRPGSALQRGSVQFLSLGPGDPSTPGWPSIKGAKRLPIDPLNGFPTSNAWALHGVPGFSAQRVGDLEAPDRTNLQNAVAAWENASGLKRDDYFATIPSLPVSYDAARPILEALGGPNVPSGWQGGLPFAYHAGPGPAEVHFKIVMDYKVRTIWNVIATLKGAVEPDRWVMLGNHRDAWTYGAVDPGSGSAATLEACRALGEAVKNGWKPRRTIVYTSWDGEEYGLVGSTEWAEEHAGEIQQKAVLMVNVDSAVGGPELTIDGIPSLRDLVLGAALDLTDPRSGQSLGRSWLDQQRNAWANSAPVDLDESVWNGGSPTSNETAPFLPQLDALGSGSDYTVFVDHLGVPAVDVDFKGHYGVYHSIYDDFFWMEKFGDPEFLTHATSAKLYTLILMRAAAAEVVPLRFEPYGDAIKEAVDDLRRMVIRKARASGKPQAFGSLPAIVTAVKRLRAQAVALDRATAALLKRETVSAEQLARVNDALTQVERAFLRREGLPGRPWFQHVLYAPGVTTGYAAWTLPGVRQALLENNPKMLESQSAALIEQLDAATDALRKATDASSR